MKKGMGCKGLTLVDKYLFVYLPFHPNAIGSKKLYFPLHRLMMEWKLGRRLTKEEIVHHKDGDPFNNHPDNLEILAADIHNKITAAARKKGQDGRFLSNSLGKKRGRKLEKIGQQISSSFHPQLIPHVVHTPYAHNPHIHSANSNHKSSI